MPFPVGDQAVAETLLGKNVSWSGQPLVFGTFQTCAVPVIFVEKATSLPSGESVGAAALRMLRYWRSGYDVCAFPGSDAAISKQAISAWRMKRYSSIVLRKVHRAAGEFLPPAKELPAF